MPNSKYVSTTRGTIGVGFDLDGVLLYNPARILRRFVALFKQVFFPKQKLHFYYPKTKLEQMVWHLFHYSSIFTAPGMNDIKALVKKKKIRAYLITARYGFLGHTVETWIKKNKLEDVFSGVYYNKKNEQPHQFKLRMVQELRLGAYVEDNYDIVSYLAGKVHMPVIWIYNIFDRKLSAKFKVPTLKKAVELVEEVVVHP